MSRSASGRCPAATTCGWAWRRPRWSGGAQASVVALFDEEGTTVSELARRMGVTRRTVHQAVRELAEMGRLDQLSDPASARRRPIRGTGEGQGRRTQSSTQVRPG
ncbi:helix-turn-helix domain-containing protein [Streptomyces sp. H49]|uniref:helix-turn-helix domain-containing protein n=1 Tax=Streptomyces sp. H49 TaxID=3444117 RepID=UPI003F4AA85D